MLSNFLHGSVDFNTAICQDPVKEVLALRSITSILCRRISILLRVVKISVSTLSFKAFTIQ